MVNLKKHHSRWLVLFVYEKVKYHCPLTSHFLSQCPPPTPLPTFVDEIALILLHQGDERGGRNNV